MPDAGWGHSAPQEAPPARRPPRRRRRGTKWLIALVVLIALLVAADRIALLVAENQLADRIESSQHLSSKPGVSVDGFPFLNQVIARDFPHATVDIHDLDANGLTITNLHADLHGVHVNSGFNSAVVDTLTATAQMSYTDIAKALASKVSLGGAQIGTVQITPASGDEVKASYSDRSAGVAFSATVARDPGPGHQHPGVQVGRLRARRSPPSTAACRTSTPSTPWPDCPSASS